MPDIFDFAAQGGPTLPPRHEMTDVVAIRARMLGDVKRLHRDNPEGIICLPDLGWTHAQVLAHSGPVKREADKWFAGLIRPDDEEMQARNRAHEVA